MTLKEKFDNLDYFDSSDIFNNLSHDSHECEKIADEFAIEFAEWKDENCFNQGDGFYNRNYKDEAFLLKELLEIYKKEKGL
jgi:hypothetical protein